MHEVICFLKGFGVVACIIGFVFFTITALDSNQRWAKIYLYSLVSVICIFLVSIVSYSIGQSICGGH